MNSSKSCKLNKKTIKLSLQKYTITGTDVDLRKLSLSSSKTVLLLVLGIVMQQCLILQGVQDTVLIFNNSNGIKPEDQSILNTPLSGSTSSTIDLKRKKRTLNQSNSEPSLSSTTLNGSDKSSSHRNRVGRMVVV
ncbi:hypothetical protein RB653_003181 [Dictyostelium firmibasis]|uniref:Uncharacterized protein n=1 Tax=Dictyostelium firmibasis TaxID=79012 RepID=A0AAN7TZ72_9MYCE